MLRTKTPKLSIIVPFFNEEACIALMYERVTRALAATGEDYELIFVDDGSSDATFAIAEELARSDLHLRVVKFRANYGQTPAMAAGIDAAGGEVLITMDGDLQNDPGDIPLFLGEIDKGYDLVVGWRHKRQDKFLTRRLPSIIANWIIGKVTGVPIKDNGCSLKAYRADVIKHVPLYSEMHRFIPAMASLSGARIAEIKVRHHERTHGVSKYGLSRIYKVILDLIAIKTLIGFSGRPLQWFAKLSAPFGIAGLVLLPFAVVNLVKSEINVALNFGAITLVLAATCSFLFALGILGELIYKTGTTRMESLARLAIKKSSTTEFAAPD
jgi:glycosyltransferase involved in cell wall biosynthesis